MEVKVEVSDIRIDKYLSGVIDESRENIVKMIDAEFILVDGKKVKPSYKVKIGEVIEIKEGFKKEVHVDATPMNLDIVFEDEYLMVINKPSGLVVHPGNGNHSNTLVNGLKYYTDNLSEGSDDLRPGIVHRLDKDTSGLMLVCKSDKCHELLADDFKNKRVYREYVALLEGVFPQEKAIVDAPIGRSKENFQKMAIMKDGKNAVTHIEIIKRYKEHSLVKLVLETGRTHQIRVHLSSIGYPVFNDPLYGKKKCTEFGQFLHSRYIKFTHPITKEILEFERDVPQEFSGFLKTLEEDN